MSWLPKHHLLRIYVISQPLSEKNYTPPNSEEPLMDIDWKLHVLTYTVYRKHYQFTFKKHYDQLSKIMFLKEFGFKKGDLVFVTQNYESSELIILLDKGLQITIQNYFFCIHWKLDKRSNLSRWIYQNLYPLARKRFLNAKIVLDRFHISHHLGHVFLKTRFRLWTNLIRSHYPIVP